MADAPAVEVAAPAKVNLLLRVLDRRADGFHELETLFQAIDFGDRLTLARSETPGVELEVVGAELGPAADNLVVRAARAFLDRWAPGGGVRVTLEKRVPAGAGLGGGSSDAGATLRALPGLFGVDVAGDELHPLASELGSDVPFFLGPSGYAVATGRGERTRGLPPLPEAWLVVGLPPVHVATGPAFGALAEARRGGPAPRPVLGASPPPSTWSEVARLASNDFESGVVERYPEVGRALDALRQGEPELALLSGSGGAVFAVHRARPRAEAAADQARAHAPSSRFVVARTLGLLPPPEPARA